MIHSEPYKPNPEMACEACVFGSGEHASWCDEMPCPPGFSGIGRDLLPKKPEPGPAFDPHVPLGALHDDYSEAD